MREGHNRTSRAMAAPASADSASLRALVRVQAARASDAQVRLLSRLAFCAFGEPQAAVSSN